MSHRMCWCVRQRYSWILCTGRSRHSVLRYNQMFPETISQSMESDYTFSHSRPFYVEIQMRAQRLCNEKTEGYQRLSIGNFSPQLTRKVIRFVHVPDVRWTLPWKNNFQILNRVQPANEFGHRWCISAGGRMVEYVTEKKIAIFTFSCGYFGPFFSVSMYWPISEFISSSSGSKRRANP